MLSQTVVYLVAPGERPPFGQVPDHLWGPAANVDSDGNSRTPDDTQWTELSLFLRGADDVEVYVDPVATSPLTLQIRSSNAYLVERTARFLSEKTMGRIELSMPSSKS